MDTGFSKGIIVFNNHKDVFYSGQVISGKFSFVLDNPLSYSAIKILYCGQATVSWKEYESEEYNGQRRTKTMNYEGHQDYFQFIECLSGGTGVSTLRPGNHTYQFRYQTPHVAPSSFSGEKGQVAYYVMVFVEYPDTTKKSENVRKEFKVVAPLDLNKANPAVKEPVEMEFEEVYSACCLCDSKPMTIRIRLPVTGYCPGQSIPISLKVENDSVYEIYKIIFQLTEKERYQSQFPASEFISSEKILTTIKRGPILSKTHGEYTFNLTVPDMVAVNLENCSMIDVGYFFKVTMKLSGCNEDLIDDSEICLGLVPLLETLNGPYVHPMAHELPTEPIPDPNVSNNTYYAQNMGYPQNPASNYPHSSVNVGNPTAPTLDMLPNADVGFKVPVLD